MVKRSSQPWATGPAEILKHALDLLEMDTDTNRRLAIIAIDNAVELMIKTYLGLPKRINGLSISRKEIAEISESFPKLLDAVEKYADDKIDGIDLGEIEWYHRLRNELYHQGNGLTVERDKVEVYSQLGKLLFKNLYGIDLLPSEPSCTDLLGRFMSIWVVFEKKLHYLAAQRGKKPYPRALIDGMRSMVESGLLTQDDLQKFEMLRRIRNEVVHGVADHQEVITTELLDDLQMLVKKIPGEG